MAQVGEETQGMSLTRALPTEADEDRPRGGNGPIDIGRAFAEDWDAVFAEVQGDEDAARYFAQFVVANGIEAEWMWAPGQLRKSKESSVWPGPCFK